MNALWIYLKIFFFFCISIRSCVFNYRFKIHRHLRTQTHTHIALQYLCLFILCRLIPKWHFLWSAIYVSPQTGLPSLLLLSRLLCVSVFLYMHSQWKQWLFPVKKNWVCQVLKRGRDKWREGMRGCKDNSLLWWLTFQGGVSNEHMTVLLWIHWQHNDWRSQEQFQPSGWEVHPKLWLTCSSSFPLENRAVVKRFGQRGRGWALPFRTVSQPASWLTGCSVCQVESPTSCRTALIDVTWSKSNQAKAVCCCCCCCWKLQMLGKSLLFLLPVGLKAADLQALLKPCISFTHKPRLSPIA